MSPHYVISSSYGNDSVALIQWAYETGLSLFGKVTVAYCDTGWAKPEWAERVEKGEEFARQLGFDVKRVTSMGMTELVRMKDGWPGNGQQFCTAHLKGIPFLTWIDEDDTECEAVVLVGKRRAESPKRADTPEFVPDSDYHGGRLLWHPLYMHSDEQRNALLARGGGGGTFCRTAARNATLASMPTVATFCGSPLARWPRSMNWRSRSAARCSAPSGSTASASMASSCGRASANTMKQIFPKTRAAALHSGVDFN